MAERGLRPGCATYEFALLVVATDEEMMVTQHAAALLRGRTEGEGNRRKNGLMT